MNAVRFPGPLWRTIIRDGSFWIPARRAPRKGSTIQIQTPPGHLWKNAKVQFVSAPVIDLDRPRNPPVVRVRFTLM